MWLVMFGFPDKTDSFCIAKTGIARDTFYEYKKAWLTLFQ